MSVLIARGAGVRRRRHQWLFRDLDVTVAPGDTVTVVGPPGSGRTTVLLALARRFRLTAGRVEIDGRASLGYVPEASAPEPVFTVTEHIRERLTLLGHSRSSAASVPLHGLDPHKQGQDLSPYEKQVLGLILAELATPAVIALDGFDEGLIAAEQAALWQLISEAAARGIAVVMTAREIDESLFTTVIHLGADEAQLQKSPRRQAEEPTPNADNAVEAKRVVDGAATATPTVNGVPGAVPAVDGGREEALVVDGGRDVVPVVAGVRDEGGQR